MTMLPVASTNNFAKLQRKGESCPCRGYAGNASWLRKAAADPKAHHPSCPRPQSVTAHAVDRYIERHRPELVSKKDGGVGLASALLHTAARKHLEALMRSAVLHEVEPGKASIWRTPTGILLGVRDRVVTTVLPLGSRATNRRPRRSRR